MLDEMFAESAEVLIGAVNACENPENLLHNQIAANSQSISDVYSPVQVAEEVSMSERLRKG